MSYIYKNKPQKPPSPPESVPQKEDEANVKFAQIIKSLYSPHLRQKDVVQLLHKYYGWSSSESAFCDKMRRGLTLKAAGQILNVLGYELAIVKIAKYDK